MVIPSRLSPLQQAPLEVISASGDEHHLACVVNLHKNFTIGASHFDLTQQHRLLAATGPLVDGTQRFPSDIAVINLRSAL